MKKTFTAYNTNAGRLARTVYEATECSAVNPKTGAEQDAIEIVTTCGRRTCRKIIFGRAMPATLSECMSLANI
jgi:hypothetical protein